MAEAFDDDESTEGGQVAVDAESRDSQGEQQTVFGLGPRPPCPALAEELF
ncbi:hypothetical protein ABT317_08815 [Streptomyces carpinensis]|uniref:Uncharacterized protein n=1 Tax=Streptomyces carpinensis TaxID=66369 RepID=A0ABV1VZY6_9ACTN